MNITPSTKEKIETTINNYLMAGDQAKSLGFHNVANTHYSMATGYAGAAFDLKAIDSVTYGKLSEKIATRILMPELKQETLDKFA